MQWTNIHRRTTKRNMCGIFGRSHSTDNMMYSCVCVCVRVCVCVCVYAFNEDAYIVGTYGLHMQEKILKCYTYVCLRELRTPTAILHMYICMMYVCKYMCDSCRGISIADVG